MRTLSIVLILTLGSVSYAADIGITKDGQKLTANTTLKAGTYKVADAGDDGALLIEGDGITVDFKGATLDGSKAGQDPDAFTGRGIVIRGKNITLKNGKVRGYKVGIHASEAPGLTIEDFDVSGNYQKRLLSTPEAEDGSDWMFGHQNDDHEWIRNYGAAIYIEKSDGVTVRRVKCREGQNGICIDRVNKSKFYDNDCSFISGWGLAMWRSNDNVISRNAFDFCIRGYSHGVYNRGQDSAGIFMFEQNNRNVLAENSVTHGGDGFFGFAGLEALGDNKPKSDDFKYKRAGNNDNLLIANDFSYAAAHGIEMTFSFGNKYIKNRCVENAICGIWGGLSQDSLIAGNEFKGNGEMGYGLERGGINIDSGRNNKIIANLFNDNRCGVHLWGPPSADFMKKPWGVANQPESVDALIVNNIFDGDKTALHLRGKNKNIVFANNKVVNVEKEIDASADSEVVKEFSGKADFEVPRYEVYGETRPVGARKALRGRKNIIVTEWGPYDFTESIVFPTRVFGGEKATLQALGAKGKYKVKNVKGDVKVDPMEGELPGQLTVSTAKPGLHPFTLTVAMPDKEVTAQGALLVADWDVKFFKWNKGVDDPREHPDRWKEIISGKPVFEKKYSTIDFKFGGGGPDRSVGHDYFGTVATTKLPLPAGKYKIWTVSDDGIRVWIDGKEVLADWTWHGPTERTAEVDLKAGSHDIRLEHFEIDGVSQLQLRIEPASKK